jgi:hypothetical protein
MMSIMDCKLCGVGVFTGERLRAFLPQKMRNVQQIFPAGLFQNEFTLTLFAYDAVTFLFPPENLEGFAFRTFPVDAEKRSPQRKEIHNTV